jgi:hypothetical protein
MRDEFSEQTKRLLAQCVGYLCSRRECGAATVGPQDGASKTVNVGVAAHITAASAAGPRYDPLFSAKERTAAANGIWLCQNCAKLIDSDPNRFTIAVLQRWKIDREAEARRKVGLASAAERVTLQGQLTGRPFVTVTYSQNATEDEPNVFDTMVFENIGQEVAVSIDIATEPATFGAHEIRPRLVWGAVTKLKPSVPEEESVTSVDSFLRDLRAAVMRRDGRADDIRVPLTVTYSDTRERKWAETHALPYNGYGIWIENVTGRASAWTDLHGLEVAPRDRRRRPAG